MSNTALIIQIKKWLQMNHPYSSYISHELMPKHKVKIVTQYLDNSETRHGFGHGEIVTENFVVSVGEFE